MFLHLLPRHYFRKDRHFYICSFGGCGSWMLAQYLSNFGTVHHVHSRKPPTPKITLVRNERFTDEPSPYENNVVLYVYRDPIASLHSVLRRFPLEQHLRNIECSDTNVTVEDVVRTETDLFGLEEFDSNYTRPNRQREYPIYCVKYEDFFERLPEFNRVFNLIDYPKLYPLKKEHVHEKSNTPLLLERVYAPLNESMQQRPFIFRS